MFQQHSERVPLFLKRLYLAAAVAVGLAIVLAFPLGVLARGNPNAKPGELSKPVYEVVMEDRVEYPMRDGVITRGVVMRPKAEGRFPAILCTSPYSTGYHVASGKYYAERGYVYVIRDSRGRYTSDDLMTGDNIFIMERNDQYDTMDWIAKQPWSNGRIAAEGASYFGQTTLQAAMSGHPNMVCGIPQITAENLWREWYYRGGALELTLTADGASTLMGGDTANRILSGAAKEAYLETMALFAVDHTSFYNTLPIVDFAPAQIGPDYNTLKNTIQHPSMDDYWATRSVEAYLSGVTVPLLHVGGWYDVFQNGTISAYMSSTDRAYTKFARDNQYLVMAPFPHMWLRRTGDPMNALFGKAFSDITLPDLYLSFMDYWMKDVKTGHFDPDTRVVYYTMGKGGKWNTAGQWPLPNLVDTPFYFNGGTSGSIKSLNDGKLSTTPPKAGEKPRTYAYDPMNPIVSVGGNTLFQFAYGPYGSDQPGPVPQNEVDARSLTFTSDPLTKDLEIGGRVTAVLFAASSAVDTDWVVRVNDVRPDGTSINVVDGIQRARYRDSAFNPTLLTPGEIYPYEVDLWSTSYVFEAGHRIRVTVNSSSFPRWSRNMNVAEQPERAAKSVVANNTIYLDAAHPSHVILPVVSR